MNYKNILQIRIILDKLIFNVPSAFDPPGKELDSLVKECVNLGFNFNGRTGSNRENTIIFVFDRSVSDDEKTLILNHLTLVMKVPELKRCIVPENAIEYNSDLQEEPKSFWWNELPIKIDPEKHHLWMYEENVGSITYNVLRTRAGSVIYTYQNMIHREDDFPAVITQDGTQVWYKYNKVHRDIGPATVHSDGTKEWISKDLLHREDGPAIIGPTKQDWGFWIKGHRITDISKFSEFRIYNKLLLAAVST